MKVFCLRHSAEFASCLVNGKESALNILQILVVTALRNSNIAEFVFLCVMRNIGESVIWLSGPYYTKHYKL
jgi:hypothetical protein